MKATIDIYKSLDHLNERFLNKTINLSWRDRSALVDVVNYIKELELDTGDNKMYIERLVTWAFAQVFALKYSQDQGVSEVLIRDRVADKIGQIIRSPREVWLNTTAVDFYTDNPNNGMTIEEHKKNLKILIKDIIRFNISEHNV
tara:strand:+ start:2314 stop:2745 length:432 start_codon:yes stop_codon:yes gene_type:complete